MKALFANDHRFIPLDDEVYSESQFPASLWQWYLRYFDEMIVLAREGQVPQGKKREDLERSSAPGVTFALAPSLSSPRSQLLHRRGVRARVRELLGETDVVIARLPSELGLVAAREAHRVGLTWVVVVAGCPWDGLWHYGSWQAKVYAPVMSLRTRLTVARAPFALYVTRGFLQDRYPNRGGVTAACSDVEVENPSQGVLQARLRRIADQSPPIVLGLIGTLRARHKGIETVFEALCRVRDRLPLVEFRILGGGDPGPWRDEAARLGVEDLVTFSGTVPAGAPVLDWLDNVDIYLQPSFKEGLPRSLVEAMSRGCPALGSSCGGIPELLEPDCLTRPGDARELSELIARAVADIEWQRQQAKRNWRQAKGYAPNALEPRRHAFWKEVVASVSAAQLCSATFK